MLGGVFLLEKILAFKWFLITSLGIILLIFITILLLYWGKVSQYDRAEPDGQHREAAIILGAAVWGEEPSPALKERLNKGAELYQKGWVKYLILSGGKGTLKRKSEAIAMKEYLIKQGIPEDRLILEDQSTNTKENLQYVKKLLEKYQFGEVYLVTHDYHMYRGLLYAEKAGIDAVPAPAHSQVLWYPYHKSRESLALLKLQLLDE
jgi:uncharacterized SAM-binding protein YcdF (DUF218 family)